jgi:hypothetical protein
LPIDDSRNISRIHAKAIVEDAHRTIAYWHVDLQGCNQFSVRAASRDLIGDANDPLVDVAGGGPPSGQASAYTCTDTDGTYVPRYVFRGPARGPLASGPGMTVAPVERMTWGVVSPSPGGAVGDADERSGHRPVRCNAGQLAGGRSA